jgi:hypothetical protein
MWDYVGELNGYTVGQCVDVRGGNASEWRPARIAGLDADDDMYPYAIKYGDTAPADEEDRDDWVKPHNIRPRSSAPQAAPRQLQYRKVRAGGVSSGWAAFVPGAAINVVGYTHMEFREAPQHTDAEIVAELRRKYDEGESLSREIARRILDGEF